MQLENAAPEAETLTISFLNREGVCVSELHICESRPDVVSVPLRTIVSRAISLDAAAIRLAHNHPSGCEQPSAADHALTRRLSNILDPLGVRLHDHVISAGDKVFSFRSAGLI